MPSAGNLHVCSSSGSTQCAALQAWTASCKGRNLSQQATVPARARDIAIYLLRLLVPTPIQSNLLNTNHDPSRPTAPVYRPLLPEYPVTDTNTEHIRQSPTLCSSAHARLACMTANMQLLRLHVYVLAHFQHIKAFTGCLSRGDHLHRQRFPVHLSPPSPGATSSGQWCRFPWRVPHC